MANSPRNKGRCVKPQGVTGLTSGVPLFQTETTKPFADWIVWNVFRRQLRQRLVNGCWLTYIVTLANSAKQQYAGIVSDPRYKIVQYRRAICRWYFGELHQRLHLARDKLCRWIERQEGNISIHYFNSKHQIYEYYCKLTVNF